MLDSSHIPSQAQGPLIRVLPGMKERAFRHRQRVCVFRDASCPPFLDVLVERGGLISCPPPTSRLRSQAMASPYLVKVTTDYGRPVWVEEGALTFSPRKNDPLRNAE